MNGIIPANLILPKDLAPKGYELPETLEPIFDPDTGEFLRYAEKADTAEDVFVQTDEDVTGIPVDVENTVH